MEFGPLCQSLTLSRHVSGSSGWDFFLQFFHSVTRFFCLPLPSELELIDLMLGMFHPCTSVALSSDIPASVFWTSSQAANSMEANEISISTLSRPWVKLSYFSCKSFTVFFTFTWCQSRQISISQSYKATKQQSQPPQWHLSQFIFSCLKWKTHVLKSKKCESKQRTLFSESTSEESRLENLPLSSLPKMFQRFFGSGQVDRCHACWEMSNKMNQLHQFPTRLMRFANSISLRLSPGRNPLLHSTSYIHVHHMFAISCCLAFHDLQLFLQVSNLWPNKSTTVGGTCSS